VLDETNAFLDRAGFDDRWIVELQLGIGNHRNERTSDGNVRGRIRGPGRLAYLEIQRGPPTSTTVVTPLAIHTLNVAARRALFRATSLA